MAGHVTSSADVGEEFDAAVGHPEQLPHQQNTLTPRYEP